MRLPRRPASWLWSALALAPMASNGLASSATAGDGPLFRAAQMGEPVLGQSEIVTLRSGRATVRAATEQSFRKISGTLLIPDGSEVDVTAGEVSITVATGQTGITWSSLVSQGRFAVHQDSNESAETHLRLTQPLAGCGSAHRGRVRAKPAAAGRHRSTRSRHLWVSDNGGHWGTNGRYVSTTVQGTRWLTEDACGASAVRVASGVVSVRDLVHNKLITVTAGHSFTVSPPSREDRALVPRAGLVLSGVTGGSTSSFQRQTGKHPAVFGYFASWGSSVRAPLSQARAARARLLLHISTDVGYGGSASESISPAAIARGEGDEYLMQLGKELANDGRAAYVALLPEMNQANNAYSAFDPSGSRRASPNSTANFRQAWRRSVLIVRGGAVASINRRLRTLGLRPVQTSQQALPTPRVAFMWAPQTAGTPDIPANAPAAYYPGTAYVDIVGTDFYSAFPNFAGLARLYAAYPSKPFGFNEWAMWQSGDPGFVSRFFGFVRSHRRVALMVYNQGLTGGGPFRLVHFPAATLAIRRELASPRFLAYAPE
jgi:hypothetical protein